MRITPAGADAALRRGMLSLALLPADAHVDARCIDNRRRVIRSSIHYWAVDDSSGNRIRTQRYSRDCPPHRCYATNDPGVSVCSACPCEPRSEHRCYEDSFPHL